MVLSSCAGCEVYFIVGDALSPRLFKRDESAGLLTRRRLACGGTCRAATSSAAQSGARNAPRSLLFKPPAERGLVLSQRNKTHLRTKLVRCGFGFVFQNAQRSGL